MGAIKKWMTTLDDASLQRVADATSWASLQAEQSWDHWRYSGDRAGCLLCHAGANHYERFTHGRDLASGPAEQRYMKYADRRGEFVAGRLMNAFARRILATRALASMDAPLKSECVR